MAATQQHSDASQATMRREQTGQAAGGHACRSFSRTGLSLARVAGRELTWGLRTAARHARRWNAMAASIPDGPLRHTALHALATKRGHLDGAALFATLPRRRDAGLVEVLVAYQVMVDFLDSAHEQEPSQDNGLQLHRALGDALDPGRPLSDWYRHHPGSDDGGYLEALVQTCRAGCRALPSYVAIQPELLREARHGGVVLVLNHLTDSAQRDAALRTWASTHFPGETEMQWHETCALTSSTLTVHALLARAAEPGLTRLGVAAEDAAYRWTSLIPVLLDSYVDQAQDIADRQHNYLAHYPSRDVATQRTAFAIRAANQRLSGLARGPKHRVICACMIALYLSKRGANRGTMAQPTQALIAAAGPLTRLLVPVLRAWRLLNGQRST